jgi:catechol 2,3-dioxygenase-like lactoylglutathione lyase family enzyme
MRLAKPKNVNHLAFPCFDVAATEHFYGEVLELPLAFAVGGVSPEWGNRRYLHLAFTLADGAQISFFTFDGIRRPRRDSLPRDIRHAALTLPSAAAVRRGRDRLRSHGVEINEERHGSALSIYFEDPNGVMLELTDQTMSRPRRGADKRATATLARWK